MRYIKFRVWDIKNKEMVYVKGSDYPNFEICAFENTMYYYDHIKGEPGENYELMQFTGLCDMNGNEIYEEDIVKINGHEYLVDFEIGSFMLVRRSSKTDMYEQFKNCWNDDVYPLSQYYWETDEEEDMLNDCEIIGNTYQEEVKQ
jgi:uncharacterized phage protein (TIGR01671 family)